jgi:hypothetical protein
VPLKESLPKFKVGWENKIKDGEIDYEASLYCGAVHAQEQRHPPRPKTLKHLSS